MSAPERLSDDPGVGMSPAAQEALKAAQNGSLSVFEWVGIGFHAGFCSDAVCETHQGLPATEEEMELWEAGEDPCVAGVRVYQPGELHDD